MKAYRRNNKITARGIIENKNVIFKNIPIHVSNNWRTNDFEKVG